MCSHYSLSLSSELETRNMSNYDHRITETEQEDFANEQAETLHAMETMGSDGMALGDHFDLVDDVGEYFPPVDDNGEFLPPDYPDYEADFYGE